MKKKITILIVAVVIALVCAVAIPMALDTAKAEDTNVTTSGGTGSTSLTYTVAQSFTVTIPAAVTITKDGETITGSGTVSVANSIIPFGKKLTVTITGATNYDTGFRLKNDASTTYINYTIKNGDTEVAKDTAFLTVDAGDLTGSATLTYTAANTATYAGAYTDTLTFTVAVGA